MKNIQTLKGFRDFLPTEKRQRDWVMAQFVAAFERSGFDPLETPTLEYKETIMGKYGDEADKLVYNFTDRGGREVALRYDQTVPTARVVAQYQSEIPLPFRRYQTQNVFRADKPQKGRYREFTQCDIDIFGSTDLIADAEILATTYAAFTQVGFKNVQLVINDRQILMEKLSPFVTKEVTVFSIIQSIDKLDKMPAEKVIAELVSKGLTLMKAEEALLSIEKTAVTDSLKQIMDLAETLGVPKSQLVFTPSLARGLDYYTGMIFEVKVPEYGSGSLGGGGRYDKLIGQLSGRDVPAVGMAVGFDRAVEAAVELGLVEADSSSARLLVTIFDESDESVKAAAMAVSLLRDVDIPVELYPERAKLAKQLKYASRRGIRYVLILGEEERKQNLVMLKDLETGKQKQVTLSAVVAALQGEYPEGCGCGGECGGNCQCGRHHHGGGHHGAGSEDYC